MLGSPSQMTTITENRMNQEYHVDSLCDRQEQSASRPWPVLATVALGLNHVLGEGKEASTKLGPAL